MLEQVRGFLEDASENQAYNAMLYFRLKNESENGPVSYQDKLVNITNEAQGQLKEQILQAIRGKLSTFGEDTELLNVNNYDYTRNNVLYFFEDTYTQEVSFLTNDLIGNNDNFNREEAARIDGIIIRLGTTDRFINFYIPYFPIFALQRDTWFILRKMDDQFQTTDAIRFNYKPIFLYFNNKILILDFKKLEKDFGYETTMNQRACEKISMFTRQGLLSDNNTLETIIQTNQKLRNKLLKIKEDSPVFNVNKEQIVLFVRDTNNKIKIRIQDDGKFVVGNPSQAGVFLKLMDDDYVKSMLTGNQYDAEKKNKIE
ncbi:hypothetical protein BSK20_02355 [SR1 bacterium human oral taxon HOT-345]|nr:hypothetical protein BSK20_02355 [SR1 bacterium human oral taxon HOT-345]